MTASEPGEGREDILNDAVAGWVRRFRAEIEAVPFSRPVTHKPNIVTDGGPWADHDQACAVCHERAAVLDMHTWCFQPCWECQRSGWELVKHESKWSRFFSRGSRNDRQ